MEVDPKLAQDNTVEETKTGVVVEMVSMSMLISKLPKIQQCGFTGQ